MRIEGNLVELMFEYMDRYSVLPEIFSLLGPEKTLDFLEVFGGSTIKFPPRNAVAQVIRDFEIYRALNGLGGESRLVVMARLAGQHDLTEGYIKEVHDRVAAFMEKRKNGNGHSGQGDGKGDGGCTDARVTRVGAGMCSAPDAATD